MRKSNYDKFPATNVAGSLWKGWESICSELKKACNKEKFVVVI